MGGSRLPAYRRVRFTAWSWSAPPRCGPDDFNPGGQAVDPIRIQTVDLLRAHPAPALALDVIEDSLASTPAGPSAGTGNFIARLKDGTGEAEDLCVIRRPRRRWLKDLGPEAWILAPGSRRAGASAARSPAGESRLRRTLRILGETIEPGSVRSWARWTRMLEEEARIRPLMNGRTSRRDPHRGEPETPPSTSRLRDRPRRRRSPAPGQPS
jgi:hypothetical protein